MFKFDLQLFGGLFGGDEQTSTTTRNIPDETPEEAALKNALLPYVQQSLSGAFSTLSKGLSSLNNTYNPDWSSQISNYTSGTNSNLSNYNNSIASNYCGQDSRSYHRQWEVPWTNTNTNAVWFVGNLRNISTIFEYALI